MKDYYQIAKKCVSYFERLEAEEGTFWKTGLNIAEKWIESVENPTKKSIEDLKLFITREKEFTGSAWEEMKYQISEWIKHIEKSQ